jgi:hypothetical protein
MTLFNIECELEYIADDIAQLPVEIVPYIWSSRYCESDSVLHMVRTTFGSVKMARMSPHVQVIEEAGAAQAESTAQDRKNKSKEMAINI